MPSRLFHRVHFAAVVIFFFTLLTELSFLICVSPAILRGLSGWGLVIYTLIPVPVGIELHGSAHLLMTTFVIAVIIGSFTWVMLRPGEGYIHVLASKKYTLWGMGEMESIGMAFMGAASVNFFVYLIAGIIGAEPVLPEFPENELQFIELLFFASFWEELVVKLTFISLPLLFLGIIFKSRLVWWRYILGGKIQMKGITFLLMLFSALVFGILHVIGGWDWWKFIPTFVAGVLSAFLFIRFGLHASILFHFANNFLNVPSLLSNNIIVAYLISIVFLYFIFMGTIYWILMFRSLFRFSGSKDITSEKKTLSSPDGSPAPPTHIHVMTSSASPYFCATCNNDEFLFSDGQFICTRCGQKVGQAPPLEHEEKKDVMEL